ncbi:uncharacterized protein LOC124552272 [Schistocerca americana]|uniref:uncharacterized protein LOC124552272 n=1 Tax=Schistocerca americana TaxID=7009 RepID=UPI001F4FCF2D|nr:uncharacterized protein LOC124552272 [Schistocerca americana]
MRALLLVTLLVAGALATAPEKPRRHLGARNAANINDYIDQVLPNIAQFLADHGLDPIALPDDVQSFSEEGPLGIVWHGEVGLFDGSLSGLSQVVRAGDAFLDYSDLHFKVNMTLGFTAVDLTYGFECQLMDIGPKGTLYGTVHDLAVFAELSLDMSNLTSPAVALNDLYFSNAGTLDIHIEGIGLDLLDNILADIVTGLFHDVIIDAIEDKAREVIENALDGLSMKTLLPFVSRLIINHRSHL